MKEYSNVSVFNMDIAEAEADAIVNAANGWGYMGGKKARDGLLHGVAESLNRSTDGKMETYCTQKARRFAHIPSFILGKSTGEIFTSPSFGLKCKEVIHAVTMHTPGGRSSEKTVIILLNSIFKYCREAGYRTVAMPLLGAGPGGLVKFKVLYITKQTAMLFPELSVYVYTYDID